MREERADRGRKESEKHRRQTTKSMKAVPCEWAYAGSFLGRSGWIPEVRREDIISSPT